MYRIRTRARPAHPAGHALERGPTANLGRSRLSRSDKGWGMRSIDKRVENLRGSLLGRFLRMLLLEPRHRARQTFPAVDLRLPTQQRARPRDIRATQIRIVLRPLDEIHRTLAAGKPDDLLRKFEDRDLSRVADVHRVR